VHHLVNPMFLAHSQSTVQFKYTLQDSAFLFRWKNIHLMCKFSIHALKVNWRHSHSEELYNDLYFSSLEFKFNKCCVRLQNCYLWGERTVMPCCTFGNSFWSKKIPMKFCAVGQYYVLFWYTAGMVQLFIA